MHTQKPIKYFKQKHAKSWKTPNSQSSKISSDFNEKCMFSCNLIKQERVKVSYQVLKKKTLEALTWKRKTNFEWRGIKENWREKTRKRLNLIGQEVENQVYASID